MKIAGVFDELGHDLMKQVELMKEEDIKYISLRSINGKRFRDYDLENYKKEIVPILKQGAEILVLETVLGRCSLDDDIEPMIEDLKKVIEFAKVSKVDYISIYGFYKEKDKEYLKIDEAYERIAIFEKIAKENNIYLIIRNNHLTYMDKAEHINNLITKVNSKNLLFGLDPKNIILANELVLPTLRLLKDNIGLVYLNDIDKFGEDTLIGNGVCKVYDLLRVLCKDDYKGFLVIHSDMSGYIQRKRIYNKKKIPIYNLFVLTSKKYKSYKAMDEKISKKEKEEVSPEYIARLQIRFVKKILDSLK